MTTKKTRREFTDEFKREAVVLLWDSGRPLTQIAAERLRLIWAWSHRCCGAGAAWRTGRDRRHLLPGLGVLWPRCRPSRWRSAVCAGSWTGRRWSATSKRKQSASSRVRRDEVPFHRGPPQGVPRAGDVFGAAGQRQRLLCLANPWDRRLARPTGERPRPGEQDVGGGHRPCSCRQPAPLRQPARARVPAGPRKPEGFAAGASG